MTLERIFVVGVAGLCWLGCEQKSSETQTTGATQPMIQPAMPPDANDHTIDRITEARCSREVTCSNVGNGKKWTDDAACRRDVRTAIHSDYRQSECHNVEQDKVQSCLDAIRTANCESLDVLDRLTECKKGSLCKD